LPATKRYKGTFDFERRKLRREEIEQGPRMELSTIADAREKQKSLRADVKRNELYAVDMGTEVSQCIWPLKKTAAVAEK
jgi:hypothetical protein